MLLGRLLGWLLTFGAVVIAVWNALNYWRTGEFRLVTGGEFWFSVHTASLNTFQAVVQRYAAPELWDPVIQTVLLWPAVPTLLVPGLILLALCRRRG